MNTRWVQDITFAAPFEGAIPSPTAGTVERADPPEHQVRL